ncbi:S8 family serine peptidase [Dokdonia sp.]|uniref:S8 family peptidase n=1 Tax=Dokdonia sp. TaxID=2024995 RepID=UPI003267C3B2
MKKYTHNYDGDVIEFKIIEHKAKVQFIKEVNIEKLYYKGSSEKISCRRLFKKNNTYEVDLIKGLKLNDPIIDSEKELVKSKNRTYERKGEIYFGSSSVIILTDYAYSKEEIQKKINIEVGIGECKDGYANFHLITYDNDKIAEDQQKILSNLSWVSIAELNFSTIEKAPQLFEYFNPKFYNKIAPDLGEQKAYDTIKVNETHKQGYIGKKNIKVGILDSGVDLTHIDLREAIIKKYSWDFINEDSKPNPSNYDPHGTHCAGLAVGNKIGKYGVDGVATGCGLAAYRIGFSDYDENDINRIRFNIDLFKIIKALLIAGFEDKTDVINCSWTFKSPFKTLRAAIEEVATKGREGLGTPIVFSAGNKQCTQQFPSNLDSVITVAALDIDNMPKKKKECNSSDWGSNYGTKVDIAAPGTNLITTDIMYVYGANRETKPGGGNNYFLNFSGTSASAPLVTGCIALMLCQNPNLKAEEIKSIIMKEGIYTPFPSTPDNHYGVGILNVYNCVNEAIKLNNNQK